MMEKLSIETLWAIAAILVLIFSVYIGRRVYKAWTEGRRLDAVVMLVVSFILVTVILLW